jgi:hypothetical protein
MRVFLNKLGPRKGHANMSPFLLCIEISHVLPKQFFIALNHNFEESFDRNKLALDSKGSKAILNGPHFNMSSVACEMKDAISQKSSAIIGQEQDYQCDWKRVHAYPSNPWPSC